MFANPGFLMQPHRRCIPGAYRHCFSLRAQCFSLVVPSRYAHQTVSSIGRFVPYSSPVVVEDVMDAALTTSEGPERLANAGNCGSDTVESQAEMKGMTGVCDYSGDRKSPLVQTGRQ